jgi:small subunit ribosomal protein S8
MTTVDFVSDMITRIRNASLARHTFTIINYSKLNIAILNVLIAENYLEPTYEIKFTDKNKPLSIKIYLKYKGWWIKKPFFSNLKRISKPGKRVFSSYKHFHNVIDVLRYQQGIAIISTSSGVMSHKKAEKLKKGGEILCYIG